MTDCIIESIHLTWYEEQLWPVFVFPDHSVPISFLRTKPEPSALPVLLLALHTFEWRNRESIIEYDRSETYETDNCPPELRTHRREAFMEARRHGNIDHYHQLVMDKEMAERDTIYIDDDSDGATPSKSKQKRPRETVYIDDDSDGATPSKSVPRKTVFGEEEVSDDGLFVAPRSKKRASMLQRGGLSTPGPTPRKRKTCPDCRRRRRRCDHYEASGPEPLSLSNPFGDSDIDLPDPSTFTPIKRPVFTPTSKLSGKPTNVDSKYPVPKKQSELLTAKTSSGVTAPKEPEETLPVQDPSKVNVYVGLDKKLFILDRKAIDKYPSFTDHVTGDDISGYNIRCEEFEKLSSENFESVASWLTTSEYKPLLVEGKPPYLQGVRSNGQYENAAEQASLLWTMAHKLNLDDMQKLIYRKIEALGVPATNSLLILTHMVFLNSPTGTEIDDKMRDTLKNQVADRFHECMEKDPMLLNRLMKSNVEIANHIHQRWLDRPWKESSPAPSSSGFDESANYY